MSSKNRPDIRISLSISIRTAHANMNIRINLMLISLVKTRLTALYQINPLRYIYLKFIFMYSVKFFGIFDRDVGTVSAVKLQLSKEGQYKDFWYLEQVSGCTDLHPIS